MFVEVLNTVTEEPYLHFPGIYKGSNKSCSFILEIICRHFALFYYGIRRFWLTTKSNVMIGISYKDWDCNENDYHFFTR